MSAFFSSAETAFSSLSMHRMESYAEQKRNGAEKALLIAKNFEITISTILLGNNIVNIAMASIATMICITMFGDIGALVATAISTVVVLIFGEVLPKNYAKIHPEEFAMKVSLPMYVLIKLLKPASFPLVLLNRTAQKVYSDKDKNITVTEDELMKLIDSAEEEGIIEESESDLIKSALEFDEKTVDDILTPRTDVIAIDAEDSMDEIKEVLFTEKFSRVPVYEDSIDNVVGILSERDLLTAIVKGEDVSDIKKFTKEAYFVSKSMKINNLLDELQRQQIHMAIVVGEYGGTVGLVTMEDIIEELVGEIYDETDEMIELVVQNDDGSFNVNCELDLDDFFEDYYEDEPIPESEYTTVGGWAYELLEKIPDEGDSFDFVGERYKLKITVSKMDKNRIEEVVVRTTDVIEEEIIEEKL
jgi:CBS domain containing-hemolysin-like protein